MAADIATRPIQGRKWPSRNRPSRSVDVACPIKISAIIGVSEEDISLGNLGGGGDRKKQYGQQCADAISEHKSPLDG